MGKAENVPRGKPERLKWLGLLLACMLGICLVYAGTFLTLIYPLSYPALIAGTAYCAYQLSRWKSVGAVVALALLAIPVIDISAGRLAMGKICREGQPGTTVFDRASDVDGFFTDYEPGCGVVCREALMNHGFRFVEARVNADAAEERKKQTGHRGENVLYLAVRPGLYRFSLRQEEKHPDCEIFESWLAKARPPDRGEYKGVCIATVPISAEAARYEYLFQTTTEAARLGTIRIRTHQVVDRETHRVLGEYVRYSWEAEPMFSVHKWFSKRTVCPLLPGHLPWDVLTP